MIGDILYHAHRHFRALFVAGMAVGVGVMLGFGLHLLSNTVRVIVVI